jgi:hypothetical protein
VWVGTYLLTDVSGKSIRLVFEGQAVQEKLLTDVSGDLSVPYSMFKESRKK